MSDDSRELLADIAEATERIFADLGEADQDKVWDVTAWEALAAAGLTRIAVSEAEGGGGGSLREAAEVVRIAGSLAVRAPIAETSLLASWLLEAAGLPVSDGVLSTAAAGGGVTAETDGRDGWLLSGVAYRIPYARVADQVVLVAATEQGSLVVNVDASAAKVIEGENLAGDPLDDLDVSGLRVTSAAIVEADISREYALRLALSRLLLCSGAASRVLAMTLQYVGEREQFGRPIGRFQVVQHLVAELAGEVTALQIGADAALLAVESGASTAWLAVASAKVDADRSIHQLTAIAHQLHGAIGATHEHALRRFTLRLWSWREEGGTAAQWGDQIAVRMLAVGAPSLWEHVVGS